LSLRLKRALSIIFIVIAILIANLTGFERTGFFVYPERALRIIFLCANNIISGFKDLWEKYIYLIDVKKENKLLKQKNILLELEIARYSEINKENQRLRELLGFVNIYNYKAITARINAFPPAGDFRSIILDAGSRNGVRKNSPVISTGGLVGRIINVDPFTSQALLITDQNLAVPVINKRTRARGIAYGMQDKNLCIVRYIKKDDDVIIGDEFITSDLSKLYPAGIKIGEVITLPETETGEVFRTAILKPGASPDNLEEVVILVVENDGDLSKIRLEKR